MTSSPGTWPISWPAGPLPLRGLLLEQRIRLARQSPHEFAAFCFLDGSGEPLRQAAVHRALQDFLSQHAHALVELSRDHGKSVQACVRVLWELGRDPGREKRTQLGKTACLTELRPLFPIFSRLF